MNCAHRRWKYKQIKFIGIFQRRLELFTSTLLMEIRTDYIRRYFPVAMGTIHVHIADGNMYRLRLSVFSRSDGNCSLPCWRRKLKSSAITDGFTNRLWIPMHRQLMHFWLRVLICNYRGNYQWTVKILEGFLEILVQNKKFKVNSPMESPTEKLKIILFNSPSEKSQYKSH